MQWFRIATFVLLLQIICSSDGFDLFQGFLSQSEACFPIRHFLSCHRPLWKVFPLPASSPHQHSPTTLLFLFTRRNRKSAEPLHECGNALPPESTFDPLARTKIVVHGFSDGVCRSAWTREMLFQLIERDPSYNVVLVDWSWGNFFDPVGGSLNARVVGRQLAFYFSMIVRQFNYNCNLIHVIGHSFGSLAASHFGKNMRPLCSLGRITALDYPLPSLLNASEELGLNPGDADFVDAIHTTSGHCFPFYWGNPYPVGHVDFYMNDGSHQFKSCYRTAFESLLKLDWYHALSSFLLPQQCSHFESVTYFKATINARSDSSQLVGVACSSALLFQVGVCPRNCSRGYGTCMVMGMDTPLYWDFRDATRRTYYVPTSDRCPFNDYTGFSGLPVPQVNLDYGFI